MRILICGGRDFTRQDVFDKAMAAVTRNGHVIGGIEIISGMAKGADTMAVVFAKTHGYPLHEFPAKWYELGPPAGPKRNQQMIDEGHPDLVVAFPTAKSTGTWDMIRKTQKAGIKLIIVEEQKEV